MIEQTIDGGFTRPIGFVEVRGDHWDITGCNQTTDMFEADIKLMIAQHPGIHAGPFHEVQHRTASDPTDLELHKRRTRHDVTTIEIENVIGTIFLMQQLHMPGDFPKATNVRCIVQPIGSIRLKMGMQIIGMRNHQTPID